MTFVDVVVQLYAVPVRTRTYMYRPTKSHALGVSLTHLSVISRSHAWHLPYYANLTHFSQKSSKWAWFADLRMRSSQFNELAQEFAVAI